MQSVMNMQLQVQLDVDVKDWMCSPLLSITPNCRNRSPCTHIGLDAAQAQLLRSGCKRAVLTVWPLSTACTPYIQILKDDVGSNGPPAQEWQGMSPV
jgi:hypothetical protein